MRDDPDYEADEGEDEWEMECPYCDGTGDQTNGELIIDCPECGGTGWY